MVISMSNRKTIPEIRNFWSSDVDLKDYEPDDPKNFMVGVQADIGPVGESYADYFQFIICTPLWLNEEISHSLPMMRKGQLIVESYNYENICMIFNDFIQSCQADNWEEVVRLLCRVGIWDYE